MTTCEVEAEWLMRAWVNERMAPDVLPYQQEIVNTITSAIKTQQAKVRLDEVGASKLHDRIRQLEIDRLQFLLASYLRTRLHKIEKFAMNLYLHEEPAQCLSEGEIEFVSAYVDLISVHYDGAFLSDLPVRYASIGTGDSADMVETPNEDAHVFLKIRERVGAYEIPNQAQDQVFLNEGDILLSRYRCFKVLLESESADLL